MKVVILAGGRGTRLAEETVARPKPLVEVGGQPILWHIMQIYAHHGFTDFTLALGHLGEYIKRYFLDLYTVKSDLTVNVGSGEVTVHERPGFDWRVDLVDTGPETQTGGRLLRLRDWLQEGTFMLTYGDGVADIDLGAVADFHRSHGRLATVTAVRPPARFGGLVFDGDQVSRFTEKPQTGEGWVSGGFFVLEPEVLDFIDGDDTPWERAPLERLSSDGQLMAFRHDGFFQSMDTVRDRTLLESLWKVGDAPWKVWT